MTMFQHLSRMMINKSLFKKEKSIIAIISILLHDIYANNMHFIMTSVGGRFLAVHIITSLVMVGLQPTETQHLAIW